MRVVVLPRTSGRVAGMIERLVDCLEALPDPRDPRKVEHRLIDVLAIAVCAVIGEAESFEDIADYGRCKEGWLRRFLAGPTHEVSGSSARGAVSEGTVRARPRPTHPRFGEPALFSPVAIG